MPSISPVRRATFAVAAAVLVSPLVAARVLAQLGRGPTARADSVLHARGLAGSARVALDASTSRIDGGAFNTYGVSAGAFPFVREHFQLGLAPSYTMYTSPRAPTFRNYGVSATANYVFGGGTRWRGYAGAYGAGSGATGGQRDGQAGAQAGALLFLDPAVALRGELRYRAPTSGPARGRGVALALVTLDPYLFGRAGEVAPAVVGFGAVDVGGYAYHARLPFYHEWGVSATMAPYLTRWAQVGVDGQALRASDFGGVGWYQARGFGRLYLPLTVRTQPFAEGFMETSTFAGEDGGLTYYGGTLGVRQMLNARVGLDVGVRRTLEPTRTLGPAGHRYTTRFPGTTGLVAGLATRLGR